MIDIFGENYYLNIEKINTFCNLSSNTEEGEEQKVSIMKYELIKILSEVVLSEMNEIDDKLGAKGSRELSIPFKLSWNTLLRYNLIEKL
jgi:hypothetical protein